MLIVKVENELELALKQYKNKVKKTKLMEQIKSKMFNEKKSVKRRRIITRAKHKQQLQNNEK